MRNNGKVNHVVCNGRDSETDTVNCYRGFPYNVTAQAFRYLNSQQPVAFALLIERNHLGGAIHMPQNKMTVEPPVETQRAFKIHRRSGRKQPEIGTRECLRRKIGREVLLAEFYCRYTCTIHCDAGADRGIFENTAATDGDAGTGLENAAGFFND